jgi:hypothetical protein
MGGKKGNRGSGTGDQLIRYQVSGRIIAWIEVREIK